ncbi:MAG: hypothetical protein LBD75_00235 [Candidatus Peribacteria bacterium]|jgi:hypothetical protein|nr:hypothetical protein [Candidatus Peribacteria bacterium]
MLAQLSQLHWIVLFLLIGLSVIVGVLASEYFNTNLIGKNKEDFLLTTQKAYIDDTTGVLKGQGIITDGMLGKPWADIEGSVRDSGFVLDGHRAFGVTVTEDSLDKMYAKHLELNDMDKKAEFGMRTPEEHSEISKLLTTNANNANNNLYSRGGNFPMKMVLCPNEVRGVIEEEYLPERDKVHKLSVVSAVIPQQGYNLDITRLGQYFDGTHFSTVSRNRNSSRIPSAAGATAGVSAKRDSTVHGNTEANTLAVEKKVSSDGNNLILSREGDTTGSTQLIKIPLESQVEQFSSPKNAYAINHRKVKVNRR